MHATCSVLCGVNGQMSVLAREQGGSMLLFLFLLQDDLAEHLWRFTLTQV